MKIDGRNLTSQGALLTDLYQLTMAYGYWKTGKADEEAVFHLLFRKQPFNNGFTIASGLADAIEYLNGFRFAKTDLDYLATLKGNDHQSQASGCPGEHLGRRYDVGNSLR